MKKHFVFWFLDRPYRRAIDSREKTAQLFKAYRNQPEHFVFKKTGSHSYTVMARGYKNEVGFFELAD